MSAVTEAAAPGSRRGAAAHARRQVARPPAPLGARRLVGAGAAVPVHPGLHRHRCSRSTTTRAASTSPGRASPCATGQHPFADPDLAKALTNSVEIALISTAIATALGTFMAMALVRYRFRGRIDGRLLRVHAAVLARGRARRGAAGDVPDPEHQHRLRHDRDRARDVHRVLRRSNGESATGGHGPPHRGGVDGPRRDRMGDVPKDHAADDRPGRRRRGDARGGDLLRRLRDHVVQRRPDADVPAVHLRRDPPGRARRGQRAGDDAAARGAGPDGPQRPGPEALARRDARRTAG